MKTPVPGDVMENAVARDRLVVLTNDEDLFAMDYTMFPGGFIASMHTHPNQEERFELLAGRPRFKVAGKVVHPAPGDVITVPPGTPHVFRNPADEDVHLKVEFRPALRTGELFATLGAMAQAGQLSRRGIPRNLLLGALFVHEFRNEVRQAGLLRVTNILTAPFAALARALGMKLPS